MVPVRVVVPASVVDVFADVAVEELAPDALPRHREPAMGAADDPAGEQMGLVGHAPVLAVQDVLASIEGLPVDQKLVLSLVDVPVAVQLSGVESVVEDVEQRRAAEAGRVLGVRAGRHGGRRIPVSSGSDRIQRRSPMGGGPARFVAADGRTAPARRRSGAGVLRPIESARSLGVDRLVATVLAVGGVARDAGGELCGSERKRRYTNSLVRLRARGSEASQVHGGQRFGFRSMVAIEGAAVLQLL